MRDTFITFDLDFWNCSQYEDSYCLDKAKKDLDYIITNVLNHKIDRSIIKYHHHVLKYTKLYNINILINIDFHSDIINLHDYERSTFKICEGSWGNFVKCNKFLWIHPQKYYDDIISGICHNQKCENPFYKKNQGKFGIKKVVRRNDNVRFINWNKVCHVNFCISPDWTSPDIQKYAKKFFKENGIKI